MHYVALLRAINVGKRQVKMDHLRALFESWGYTEAATYIQTGNVLFFGAGTTSAIARDLEEQLADALGFDVAVVVVTAADLQAVAAHQPWSSAELTNDYKRYVTVLAAAPTKAAQQALLEVENDYQQSYLHGPAVYSAIRKDAPDPVFSNAAVEKLLGVRATTRNERVIAKLAELTGKQ